MGLPPRVSLAYSGELQGILGAAVLVAWLAGDLVVLYRAGLGPTRVWLPSALLRSLVRRGESASEDRASGLVILLSFFVWAVLTWATFVAQVVTLPWYAFYVGAIVAPLGVAVRLWSLRVLGRHFSVVVRTSAEQTLNRTGPYRRVRHPSYTGILLIGVGVPALMLSGPGLLAGLVLLPLAFGYRIRVEEAALVKRFGTEYELYRKGTWRLVPYLI